jgi:hypothetical protein
LLRRFRCSGRIAGQGVCAAVVFTFSGAGLASGCAISGVVSGFRAGRGETSVTTSKSNAAAAARVSVCVDRDMSLSLQFGSRSIFWRCFSGISAGKTMGRKYESRLGIGRLRVEQRVCAS